MDKNCIIVIHDEISIIVRIPLNEVYTNKTAIQRNKVSSLHLGSMYEIKKKCYAQDSLHVHVEILEFEKENGVHNKHVLCVKIAVCNRNVKIFSI